MYLRPSCFTEPVAGAALMGGVFTALGAAQGHPLTPQRFALTAGFLYAYSALQCPMEALHGRRSVLHNALSGGSLGALGVQSGLIGVPFLPPVYYLTHGRSFMTIAAFTVYGSIAAALASFGGKRL